MGFWELGRYNLVSEQFVPSRVKGIRQKIQTAQSRQKSYADNRHRPLEFSEGGYVFLKVTPTTRIVGLVAYQVALPPYLSNLLDVFHVSQLKKYIPDESQVLQLETVQLRNDLTYQASPVQTVERSDKQLRGKTDRLVKVEWGPRGEEEYTTELEDKMNTDYPHLFSGN
ncbi:hypothetical protein AAHE18_17G154700 [Arachis hypogaea]